MILFTCFCITVKSLTDVRQHFGGPFCSRFWYYLIERIEFSYIKQLYFSVKSQWIQYAFASRLTLKAHSSYGSKCKKESRRSRVRATGRNGSSDLFAKYCDHRRQPIFFSFKSCMLYMYICRYTIHTVCICVLCIFSVFLRQSDAKK